MVNHTLLNVYRLSSHLLKLEVSNEGATFNFNLAYLGNKTRKSWIMDVVNGFGFTVDESDMDIDPITIDLHTRGHGFTAFVTVKEVLG